MTDQTKLNAVDFLNFIKSYDGSYTWFKDVQLWLQSSPRYHKCETVDQLRCLMRRDTYFEKRHFNKLDMALEYYLETEIQ